MVEIREEVEIMRVFDLYAAVNCGVSRIQEKPGYRFQLAKPITVKHNKTQEEIQIKEFEADDTGDDVIHIYVGRETEALDADNFEIITN